MAWAPHRLLCRWGPQPQQSPDCPGTLVGCTRILNIHTQECWMVLPATSFGSLILQPVSQNMVAPQRF